jgi:hypothetical protein
MGVIMSRIPIHKHLINSRLLSGYGGWMYCTSCNKTIAYLCYITYDSFKFQFTCKCGETGSVDILFENTQETKLSEKPLVVIKNRLCCPNDNSPLVTFVEKNLDKFSYEIICKPCQQLYRQGGVIL